MKRAELAGYKAIVLTVDTPLLGHREPDVRNKFAMPGHLMLANFASIGGEHAHGVRSLEDSGLAHYVSTLFDLTLNWKDVQWLKSITKLPIVVKGILTGEDAELAVEMGCDGIMVSNHGARQLDGVSATIDALEEVVHAVKGRAEVYLDGGIRRGTDVFKVRSLSLSLPSDRSDNCFVTGVGACVGCTCCVPRSPSALGPCSQRTWLHHRTALTIELCINDSLCLLLIHSRVRREC